MLLLLLFLISLLKIIHISNKIYKYIYKNLYYLYIYLINKNKQIKKKK